MTNEKITLACDLDGVLCAWEQHFIDKVGIPYRDIPAPRCYEITKNLSVEWWATIPWMPDGRKLWVYLTKNFENISILSAPSQDPEEKSKKGKMIWLEREGIIDQVGIKNINITVEKHKYVQPEGISILIDDTEKKITKWNEAGGYGILHTDAESTIQELEQFLNTI